MKESDYQIAIIGAGAVGLAISRALAEKGNKSVLIVDRDPGFGRGISSRNSEVIHSGIYYPIDSLKSKYCIMGRELLYQYCEANKVFHQRCGKIIIADEHQKESLMDLFHLGESKNMDNLKVLSKKEISYLEPDINGSIGLRIDSTGIIDAHGLMNSFYQKSIASNHDYLFQSTVMDCAPTQNGYQLTIKSPADDLEKVTSEWVINAAGLNSDIISNMIIPENSTPDLIFSKGFYFSLASRWRNRFNHLIYPMPDKDQRSLGIHLSFDQTGSVKLGPDAHFLSDRKEDYSMDESLLKHFFEEASKYIVGLDIEDLTPNFSGIRPKIKTNDYSFADYYIAHEKENGFPGWINLIGIESPGLTSAIAIGEEIARSVNES
jgi:L-2-hydroxyglutarate oxidase LhgO